MKSYYEKTQYKSCRNFGLFTETDSLCCCCCCCCQQVSSIIHFEVALNCHQKATKSEVFSQPFDRPTQPNK